MTATAASTPAAISFMACSCGSSRLAAAVPAAAASAA